MNDSVDLWFNSWDRIGSVVVGSIFFYALVIVVVRVSGKRLTSQMNNFDWIVTVAIGSLVGGGVLLKDVSIADSTAAILIFVTLQWLTTSLVRKSDAFRKIIKPSPTLLAHKGEFLRGNMADERISEAEVRSKLREKGYTSLDDANWVVIETDGSLTVIPKKDVAINESELMDDVTAPKELVRNDTK